MIIESIMAAFLAGMLYLQEAAMPPEPEPEPDISSEEVYEEEYYDEWDESYPYEYSYTSYDASYGGYDYSVYEEPVYYGPSYDNPDLYSAGVIYDSGVRYTWYSQNILPGNGLTELNSNGRSVDDRGFVVDAQGNIAVATSMYPQGTQLDTPYGPAVVYDYCETPGTVDYYTAW